MRSKLAVSLIALTTLVGATSFAAAQNAPGAAPTTGQGTRQDNMTQPGMATERGSMERGSMNSGAPGTTTGMGRGGVQPDASGQGGSGPGSDQGGTRVAPGNTR